MINQFYQKSNFHLIFIFENCVNFISHNFHICSQFITFFT
nr:MAG TPA: hypothetical protein [Caudoviricetes sp.]